MAASKLDSSNSSTSTLVNGTTPKNILTKATKSQHILNGIDTSATSSTSAAASTSTLSGKYINSLTKHNAAFTSLLHLIPPQFYLSRDDADDLADDVPSKYMKNKRKKANEIQAKERKDKLREAKKQRLDPDNFATVTDIQAERAAKKAARQATEAEADSDLDMHLEGIVSEADQDEDQDGTRHDAHAVAGDTDDDIQDSDIEDQTVQTAPAAPPVAKRVQTEGERKASIDALRAKLHAKIAGLQRKRGLPTDVDDNGSEDGSSVISSKDELLEERRRQRFDARERKKQEKKQAKAAAKTAVKAKKAGVDNASNGQHKGKTSNVGTKAPALLVAEPDHADKRNGASKSVTDIDINGGSVNFSALDFNPVGAAGATLSEAGGKKSKLALPSDPKAALQVLEARKKQQEARKVKLAQKLGDAPEELNAKVSQYEENKQWDKVLASATGVKIRDDEKMLKKAAKRKDKQKEKSGVAWNERKQQETQKQADRQKKRQDNIAARKAAKGGKNKKGSSSTLSKSKTPAGKKPSFGKARPGFEGKKIGRSKK
ncbi:related to RRP14 - protein involved in Ribosomal RNA Processing [Melanopsichium pennsylvanicum]|uniref:Related to RRP14 - protein involved in Ribosomal RNA Processing n=2 Tax=Melanopsichium pennsylvanicum TaxID=63383 RepID=A0AAJ5C727_9BASI|nr:related to RRP14-protein involved in Ribosomal RNA Processing [Melanopsichium pennsylvanicum 4]SNX86069.1 related to RRP14 - protein involved in Ribosomal RNA Processing [Melanopsichium pennsylvanicum]